MYCEAIFQPSEKMNYNTDAKRLAGNEECPYWNIPRRCGFGSVLTCGQICPG